MLEAGAFQGLALDVGCEFVDLPNPVPHLIHDGSQGPPTGWGLDQLDDRVRHDLRVPGLIAGDECFSNA